MKEEKADEENIRKGEGNMKIYRCLRWRRRRDGTRMRKKEGIKIRQLASV
jgi:hypothetical protein